MSEHSPRRWTMNRIPYDTTFLGREAITKGNHWGIYDAEGRKIATLPEEFTASQVVAHEAHARLIVKAVNSFEGLVKALEDLLSDLAVPFNRESPLYDFINKAKAALATAKEDG